MMKKYWPIIKDALILLTVSTAFVTICNQAFKGLKKSAGSDSLVTAIHQNSSDGVKEALSEEEFKKENNGATSFEEYQKARTARTDDQKRTPLMWAAYANILDQKSLTELDSKHVSMIEILVKSGADVNARDQDEWTALMWASWSGTSQTATKLVELGADVAAIDRIGNTALTIAAQRGNVEIVRLLTNKMGGDSAAITARQNALRFAEKGLQQYPGKAEAYKTVLSLL